jgi:hypothetical protein
MSTTYTFEELAAAAAGSNSISEAVRRLGREPSPRRNRYVMGLMRTLGIDCRHFRNPSQLYTREMLGEAAAMSTSIAEVVRRIGAKEVGGTQAHIGRLLRRYEIDISHFESLRQLRRRPKEISMAEFASAVGQARSLAQVSRILGVSDGKSFRRYYRKQVAGLGLDVSHILGQAHARGTKGSRRRPLAEILIADPTARGRTRAELLRPAMIEIGIPYRCAMCGIGPDWRGHQITLEIDHINGDITDNRPQNLRFLCPNCHATTPTFCRKKQGPSSLDGSDTSR